MPPETYRIARFLARCGVASRRKAEEFVSAGRITVNGEVARDLGRQIDPQADRVLLDGKPLALPSDELTLAFNKPRRVLVSRGDPRGRRTVYDLLPLTWGVHAPRLVYAGRLDYMSEGLIVLTTDTALVQALSHPTRHVEKEYHVIVDRPLAAEDLARLNAGRVEIDGRAVSPVRARALARTDPPGYSIALQEGRNRIVRRVFETLDRRVERLMRVRIGGLTLTDLPAGAWRELGTKERALLLQNPR